MPKKAEHFVVYEIEVPIPERLRHKKRKPDTELRVVDVNISPRFLKRLKSNDSLQLVQAQELFAELAWKKLKKKYGDLRKLKQPQFDELAIVTHSKLNELRAERDKSQGASPPTSRKSSDKRAG